MVLGLTSTAAYGQRRRPGGGRGRPGPHLDRGRRHHQYTSAPDDGGGRRGDDRLREQRGDRQHHGHAAHVDVRHLRPRVQRRRRASTSWPTRTTTRAASTPPRSRSPRAGTATTARSRATAQMQGILVVTDGGGGEDTTAPETSAKVDGDQNADGAYVGQATVAVTRDRRRLGRRHRRVRARGDGAWQPYTAPVVVRRGRRPHRSATAPPTRRATRRRRRPSTSRSSRRRRTTRPRRRPRRP